ncbi:MAG: YHYH protein [Limisphaerales bacterium]
MMKKRRIIPIVSAACVFLVLLLVVPLRAARIRIQPSDFPQGGGQMRITLTGESGVQYYVRSASDLNGEWSLVSSEAFPGADTAEAIEFPWDGSSWRQAFFAAESPFERRARLFIASYQRQLAQGGPTVLSVNGLEVQNTITIAEDRASNQMVITGNGVPNYVPRVVGLEVTDGWNAPISGGFQSIKFSENNSGSNGGNNPNRIVVATETFRIPLNPSLNATPTDTALGSVGVAINGIPIYNPFEDPNQTAATGRIFSSCCGHPQLNGIYHYHKYPTCLKLLKGDVWQSEKEKCDEVDGLLAAGAHSPLIGFALDGWPIYGPVGWSDAQRVSSLLKSSYTGSNDSYGNPVYVAGSGDLDECNGLISPTPEYPEGIYHYVMSLHADEQGRVVREISPYFGYDIRNTLKKHGLMPAGWDDDTAYVQSLKSGFLVGDVSIPGTDSPGFQTFYQFVTNMVAELEAGAYPDVAAEFQSMKIAYPFTIRKYRGTPSAGGGNTGPDTGGVVAIVPQSASRGDSLLVTVTLQAMAGTPGLPPVGAPISSATVGGLALVNPVRASETTVTGTLHIPANAAVGLQDVRISFTGPPGQPAPTYSGTDLFGFL